MSGDDEHSDPGFTEMPLPPTAGQILGFVIRHLGGLKRPFDGKQHQRFFSGSEDYKVALETKADIISDIAEWIMETGLLPRNRNAPEDRVFGGVAAFLHTHISEWEWWRNHVFERPVYLPKDVVLATQASYVRIITIELALRIAAGMVLSSVPRKRADLIQYVAEARPGDFLKDLQKDAGISRDQLSLELDRAANTIDNWLDQDARPRDDALHELASILVNHLQGSQATTIEGDLRRLYLLDDITELLAEYVGNDLVSQCLERLHKYVGYSYDYLMASALAGQAPDSIGSILLLGTSSPASRPVLGALVRKEGDEVWGRELQSANLPWQMRITLDTMEALTSDYEQNRWLLGDHAKDAFGQHFDKYGDEVRRALDEGMLLLQEGKLFESDAVLAKITELDPSDAKLHELVGISKKDFGHRLGNREILEEALEALWLAATLDNTGLQSWTSIGHTLTMLNRNKEAIAHMESVDPDRGELDVKYYIVLSIAYKVQGDFNKSLSLLESAMELNPSDPEPPHLAAQVAALSGNKSTTRRYARQARRLGMPEAELAMLQNMAEWVSVNGPPEQ